MSREDDSEHITGYYFEQQKSIIVTCEKHVNNLTNLGNFGYELKRTERKDDNRRGAYDRYLSNTFKDINSNHVKILSQEEAFFLLSIRKLLSITQDNHELTLEDCWTKFCNQDELFHIRYAAYQYFRTKNWVVKNGSDYGTHYLLYDNSNHDHSIYAVLLIPVDTNGGLDCVSLKWIHLMTIHRVVKSVRKQLLLTFITKPNNNNDQTCIKEMRITNKILSRLGDFVDA